LEFFLSVEAHESTHWKWMAWVSEILWREPNSQREVPDMDFIKSAKATGIHFSDTTQHNEIHETPDSKPGANDGSGAKGWVCAAKC
jgi:hypothetical protein